MALDLSALLFSTEGESWDYIYSPLYKPEIFARFGLPPGKLEAAGGALKQTGDDMEGDSGGDDGLDNEIITVDLAAVPQSVGQIFSFLNNCGDQVFSKIPYAKIRLFEGLQRTCEKFLPPTTLLRNVRMKTAVRW